MSLEATRSFPLVANEGKEERRIIIEGIERKHFSASSFPRMWESFFNSLYFF